MNVELYLNPSIKNRTIDFFLEIEFKRVDIIRNTLGYCFSFRSLLLFLKLFVRRMIQLFNSIVDNSTITSRLIFYRVEIKRYYR